MEKSKSKTINKYATSGNYSYSNKLKSKNSGLSDTVAGESFTIQELFKRHLSGSMPPIGLDPQYDYDEATHEDNTSLRKPDADLTDLDNLKNEVENTHKKQKQIQKTKKDKDDARKASSTKDEIIRSHMEKISEAEKIHKDQK